MSNYKWIQTNGYVSLRKEDFSSFQSFEVTGIDPILMRKIKENGITYSIMDGGFLMPYRYVLYAFDRKIVTITAPLYEHNLDSDEYVLLSESYTDEVVDPTEYEWVKETYYRCVEEVTNEQAKIFGEQFMEKSLDGISSVINISSDLYEFPGHIYEWYIPKEYIKVCERNEPFTRTRHEVVFIKNINAEGKTISIKVPDLYKGLVIGKGGENIKRVAKIINAKRINVI